MVFLLVSSALHLTSIFNLFIMLYFAQMLSPSTFGHIAIRTFGRSPTSKVYIYKCVFPMMYDFRGTTLERTHKLDFRNSEGLTPQSFLLF